MVRHLSTLFRPIAWLSAALFLTLSFSTPVRAAQTPNADAPRRSQVSAPIDMTSGNDVVRRTPHTPTRLFGDPSPWLRRDAALQADTPIWSRLAMGAIVGNAIAHAADLSTTMYGIGSGQLIEQNPLLKPLVHEPTLMALAKSGVAVAQTLIFRKFRKTHPKWTFVVAAASATATGWAASHNRRQLERR